MWEVSVGFSLSSRNKLGTPTRSSANKFALPSVKWTKWKEKKDSKSITDVIAPPKVLVVLVLSLVAEADVYESK